MMLKANPKASRQLALDGPLLLWRDKAGGGREGLLVMCTVCSDPACTGRHVFIDTRWVEDRLISANLLRTKLVMRSRAGTGEAVRHGFYASVGVDDGAIELRDRFADPAAVDWFRAELDAELRAVLLARFEGERRRIRECRAEVATSVAPPVPAKELGADDILRSKAASFPSTLAPSSLVATSGRPGRNDPCPCGSGLKFKRCCLGRAA